MSKHAEWLSERVKFIKGLRSPTETQKMLVELAEVESPSKQEMKQIDALVRLEKINEKADEAKSAALRMLNARREEQRKLRTQQLIELGGVVTMVDFSMDRGTLAGALLWALDQFGTDDDLQHTLKKRGDAFIFQRENEKKVGTQGSAEVAAEAAAAEKTPA
jgi:hypothetical protein